MGRNIDKGRYALKTFCKIKTMEDVYGELIWVIENYEEGNLKMVENALRRIGVIHKA